MGPDATLAFDIAVCYDKHCGVPQSTASVLVVSAGGSSADVYFVLERSCLRQSGKLGWKHGRSIALRLVLAFGEDGLGGLETNIKMIKPALYAPPQDLDLSVRCLLSRHGPTIHTCPAILRCSRF